jgi:hypothetical protein
MSSAPGGIRQAQPQASALSQGHDLLLLWTPADVRTPSRQDRRLLRVLQLHRQAQRRVMRRAPHPRRPR